MNMHKLCAYQFWIRIDLEGVVEGEGRRGGGGGGGGGGQHVHWWLLCTHESDMWRSQVENEF